MLFQDLTLPRGDSREYRLEVIDQDGNVCNLTGTTVRFTVKKNNGLADPGEFQLSSANAAQIEVDDPGNGKARIYVKNIHTQNLEIRRFIYDVQGTDASGGVKTYVGGTFTIIEDATRTI